MGRHRHRGTGKRRQKRNDRIDSICSEIAEQFTHRDVVEYEDMYELLKSKYGGDPPALPNVLRLLVRHDPTAPPVVPEGGTFSAFIDALTAEQPTGEEKFYAKWRVRDKNGTIITTTKASDLTKKNYALICFSKKFRNMWAKCKIRPLEEPFKEYGYRLGSYPGAWADYEGC